MCMKVPTGGGKTFMACASIRKIFSGMPEEKTKVVVWLVPSDSILSQTIRTLSSVGHDYRQRLDFCKRLRHTLLGQQMVRNRRVLWQGNLPCTRPVRRELDRIIAKLEGTIRIVSELREECAT